MKNLTKNISHAFFALTLIFTLVATPALEAASLTNLSNTQSSLKISTASSHAIRFLTPSGASTAGQTIIVTFPADFNFTSKTIGTVTLTHGPTTGLENTETLAAAPSTTAWGAVFSGTQNRILTLTAPTDGVGAAAIASSSRVIISYTNANSINPTTATTTGSVISIGGTFGDAGTITTNVLTDDQVFVTALVPQTLTFAISDNTIGFGTLLSTAARFATGDTLGSSTETEAHTLTVGTNAANGYVLTLNGSTLTYASSTITAIGAANTASSVGTEQFGMRYTATGGTGAVSAPYAAAGFAFDTAAVPDEIASAAGSTNTTTYSARYIANITANTEAGTYSTALTYIATANF